MQEVTFKDLKKRFSLEAKAAYISLLDKQLLQIAQNIDKTPYNALKMVSRGRHLSMNLKYCRKIYASCLRQKAGIESEIIDLLRECRAQSLLDIISRLH